MVNGELIKLSEEEQAQYEAQAAKDLELPYQVARAVAYDPIGDQLDAVLKQFNYMRMNGIELVEDLDTVINNWLKVKQDYPKN
jgi:hypothetical protein